MTNGRPRLTSRSEDLAFIAETGETHVGAAERLGLNLTTLEKWCRTHDRHTWTRLVANSHALGHGARRGQLQKAIA